MNIYWVRCYTYKEAIDFRYAIYLHEWNGKPFYWGKAHTRDFGIRYNPSYKHWIEGCLRHGASLYVGKLPEVGDHTIDDIENFLIATYPSEMNIKKGAFKASVHITHSGDIPPTITG